MKISFISTVYNEEKTIGWMLESLAKQTRMPDEMIIVDGDSTDSTLSVIFNFQFSIFNQNTKNKFSKIKILTKKGNRAVGRNEAIRNATGDIIVCSDAGCQLDKDWVKNIVKPFENPKVDVVAGYYAAKPQSIFQKCLVPYVLVMPDKIDPKNFLPASRTMAFRKSIWEKVGGFPERYSHNEDYVFAKKLKHIGVNIVFAKDAIVYWMPRKNLKQAFIMFFRFAFGDAEARIFRPKVFLIFVRYLFVFFLIFLLIGFQLYAIRYTLYAMFLLYVTWSVWKNYKYVADWRAIVILPILQITADIAVILGTIWGIQHRQ
ncbi:MAG: glycosyltransferase [Candidatus Levyibacteriota bacterium]|nr:MAG: glycosyltransferase [Candidatus Levybacteria bacterium]